MSVCAGKLTAYMCSAVRDQHKLHCTRLRQPTRPLLHTDSRFKKQLKNTGKDKEDNLYHSTYKKEHHKCWGHTSKLRGNSTKCQLWEMEGGQDKWLVLLKNRLHRSFNQLWCSLKPPHLTLLLLLLLLLITNSLKSNSRKRVQLKSEVRSTERPCKS